MHLRRRTAVSSAALVVVATAGVLTAGGLAPALAQSAAPASGSAATRTVTAGPATLTVPAGWKVADPAGCVRLDKHAIYVGHADPSAACSAKAVGRTEAVHIEPLDASVSPAANVPSLTWSQLAAAPARARDAVANQYEVVVSDLKVLVTASYATDPATIEQVLTSVHPATRPASWKTVSTAAVAGEYAAARASSVVNAARAPRQATMSTSNSGRTSNVTAPFNGLGFDACTAPSVGAMSAWLGSWYRSVGIYIGGPDRACGDGNLNSSWVSSVTGMGWKLIPIYVGLQAPCWPYNGGKINPAYAATQGQQAAADAAANMARFGMATAGNPIYLDMEGYPTSNTTCSDAVKSFTIAWTAELHRRGFRSGFYSSASTGIADLVRWYGGQSPDDVWFADWNNSAVTTDWVFPTTSYWPSHQRAHQFMGDHNETYGGYTINIDSNRVDSDVVGDPPRTVPPTSPPSGPSQQPLSPLPPTSDVFHSLPTARVYDSANTPLVGMVDREVKVTGLGGIPTTGVDAVVLNVEVQDPTKPGYIRVTPGGYTTQTAVQEFSAGQTISGLTQVRLGAGGTVRLHLSAGSARVFMDVAGYYTSSGTADTYHPLATARIYGTNAPRLAAGYDLHLPVAGQGGVPATGATSVVANIEVQDASAAGYIRVSPDDQMNATAVQEFVTGKPGHAVSNLTTVKIAPNGEILLHLSRGSAAVFVDVVGYYGGTDGDRFHPLTTTRAYANLPLAAGADQDVTFWNMAGVPTTAKSVTVNVEVQAPTALGYIRVTPGGTDSQTAVQEFDAGQTISNLVTVKLDTAGRARLHLSAGSAVLFLDVVGYTAAS